MFVSLLHTLLRTGRTFVFFRTVCVKDLLERSCLCLVFLQLSQLRGNNRKFTLLHALVEQIVLREPSLATFFLALAEFETVSGGTLIKISLKEKM